MRTLAVFLALSSAAAAQVTGTLRYQDRTYDSTGFTGTLMRPVRQAELEIVRASDNFRFNVGTTDDLGAFSIGSIPPGEVVRFRVFASRSSGGINAVVKNNAGAALTYAVLGPAIDTSVTTDFGTVDFTIAGGGAPAFNLFDCAVKSFQYLATIQAPPPTLPLLTLYWESGTSNGTYFDRPANAVFLLGLTSDPDEYDDDIILHEIGHWIAFNFSKDDTLGGSHTVVDQLDPRTSWSEGWAHYWSATVRRMFPAEYAAPQVQVDNFGISHSSFDIEGPSFPTQAVMATNELAVACVLWDITDAANEVPFDNATGNEVAIWRVMTVDIPASTNITLEDFHAGLTIEAPLIMPGVTGSETTPGIFKDRLIRYYPDGSEPNDTPGTAAALALGPAGLTLRTLVAPGADADWFVVNATPGTLVVETLNLGDGADTVLDLFDAAGVVPLASNDNRTPTDPSSQITWVVPVATTYRVRVTAHPGVVEHGYYDLRAQIVINAPPVILGVTASRTSGTVPLRVTFSADIVDVDGGSHEYQWDFDGDGRVDWSSLTGPQVTVTYDRLGSYLARFRLIDSGDSLVTAPILITALPPIEPSIVMSPTTPAGATPLSVAFDASVSGAVPTAYSWDFDGDGIPDFVSTSSAAATFVFRSPGTVFPRLVVRDTRGVATVAVGAAISISSGASPPSISAFSATDGLIPYPTTFTIDHSDLGPSGTVEVDVDGDGRYDVQVPPGSATGTVLSWEIQRAGVLVPRVRVTDSAGHSVSLAGSFSARSVGATGWMVDPRAGDRLAGASVTLTAEAVPGGVAKTVQFQSRDALGGPWVDIGPPITSTGTLFSTSWKLIGIPDLSSFDLRILIDGTASSGDTANTVVIDSAAPTVSENAANRTRTMRTDRTTISRNTKGAWVIVPMGATADALPLSLSPATRQIPDGHRLGSTQAVQGWQIDFAGTFITPFRLRLPLPPGGGPELEIRRYDAAARAWTLLSFPHISPSDGWLEADANAAGFYALIEGPLEGSSKKSCGATGLEAFLAAGLIVLFRRRRC